jgi:hypothetical protein
MSLDLRKAIARAAEELSQAARKRAARRTYVKGVYEKTMAEATLIADALAAEGVDPKSPLGVRVMAELLARAVPELSEMNEEEGPFDFPNGW